MHAYYCALRPTCRLNILHLLACVCTQIPTLSSRQLEFSSSLQLPAPDLHGERAPLRAVGGRRQGSRLGAGMCGCRGWFGFKHERLLHPVWLMNLSAMAMCDRRWCNATTTQMCPSCTSRPRRHPPPGIHSLPPLFLPIFRVFRTPCRYTSSCCTSCSLQECCSGLGARPRCRWARARLTELLREQTGKGSLRS